MKLYFNAEDAVSDLHKKGYTNDFQLTGNDLLWIQEKIFIRVGEFSILEYHKIIQLKFKIDQVVIYGVDAPWHNVKGILVCHYKNYFHTIPPVIKKKLNELHAVVGLNTIG